MESVFSLVQWIVAFKRSLKREWKGWYTFLDVFTYLVVGGVSRENGKSTRRVVHYCNIVQYEEFQQRMECLENYGVGAGFEPPPPVRESLNREYGDTIGT